MLGEILTSDGFLFWTLVIVQSALIVWFVETGNAIAAAVTLVTLIVGSGFFPGEWEWMVSGSVSDIGLWGWFQQNAWRLLAFAGCYALIGLAWATFRWWLLVAELRDTYETRKTEWLAPGRLLETAGILSARADYVSAEQKKIRYQEWADVCRRAASAGGNRLTKDLKPVWKDFVENGFRFH